MPSLCDQDPRRVSVRAKKAPKLISNFGAFIANFYC
jgi:hypothetical protein